VADGERRTLRMEDDDRAFVYATWSRSGKRVHLMVGRSWGRTDHAGAATLTRDQAKDLAAFLTQALDDAAR